MEVSYQLHAPAGVSFGEWAFGIQYIDSSGTPRHLTIIRVRLLMEKSIKIVLTEIQRDDVRVDLTGSG
jgi:hypothetical protein